MHGAIIKATCATVTVPIPGLDPTSMPNLVPAGNGVNHRKSNKQAGLIDNYSLTVVHSQFLFLISLPSVRTYAGVRWIGWRFYW